MSRFLDTLLRMVYLLKGVIAVLMALLVGAWLIWLTDADPFHAYSALFGGAFFDYYGFASTLVKRTLSSCRMQGEPTMAELFKQGRFDQRMSSRIQTLWKRWGC